MPSALSAEARALFRNLVDIVINEVLDSIKDGNFLTICQLFEIDCTLMSLVYTE